jgi:outer membrane biosynthesis protein TonB
MRARASVGLPETSRYSHRMDAEKISKDVAERVRAIVSEAEEGAARIVREAEEEARRIRDRAEAEARDRLQEVRAALDELQGKLAAGPSADAAPPPGGGPTTGEVEPGPVTVPEPQPPSEPMPAPEPVPEPSPAPPTEPEPPVIPEPTPPPDEGTPPEVGRASEPAARSGDAAGARLVAMNMALAGASREEIEAHLADNYALQDTGSIVDDVLSLAAK